MKKKVKTAALQDEFQNLLADIESLLKESANLTGDEYDRIMEKVHERIAVTKKSILKFSKDFARSSSKTASRANREIHEEPWKAIGAGAVAGLLLGMLFTRK
jgi:ElaB/YqjD/DUF883 family membrane-anchored ribosome-binding protein